MILPIYLIAAHFVGDFLLQTNWMALGKSKKMLPLLLHVLVYTCVVTAMFSVATHPAARHLFAFFCMTAGFHLITDAITSRMSSAFWFVRIFSQDDVGGQPYFYGTYDMLKRKLFFWTLGLDQLLHYAALAWTLKLIGG